MTQQNKRNKEEWMSRFINLPPKEQIQFIYRESLENALRKELEEKVFGKDKRR
ncbi:hypothetical protein GLW08_10410 [Pontibacillus yanchengensis]|uniref:Uncharacterized protein n=1 Tax=Pontibacillus yanchengensis TaxID=462910 RepID=A0ACC7VG44_9BACI|nr:hypothetical protein [Pontibacillus yanchengensis]MYL53748.1 hypothetical protein [Pontibacillus yanchengensis]